mmetsp:Transcript_1901/g.5036  ORF Transcript_1901/g.5036 Transcript_1901/m.5036 type:complete len:124 (-) Transcript_1901:417-788(-)
MTMMMMMIELLKRAIAWTAKTLRKRKTRSYTGSILSNNGLTRSTATTEHKNPSASSYYLLPTDGHPTHDCRHLDTPTRATSQENNVMQQMMMMNESIHSPITSTAEQKDASSFPGSARPYYYW